MTRLRRLVASKTFRILLVLVVAVAVLGAIFGDPGDGDPPHQAKERVFNTTTPTVTVSPTDTKLPPISHPPPPPPAPPAPRPKPPPQPDTSNSPECLAERQRFGQWLIDMGTLIEGVEYAMIFGDLESVQLNYLAAGNLIRDQLPKRASFVSSACTGARPEMNRVVQRVQADWRTVEEACGRELAHVGFRC